MTGSYKQITNRSKPDAELARQRRAANDEHFRAAFAAARGTVSPELDLSVDPDDACDQGC